LADLVERYYRTTSDAEAQRLERGQLCWGPGLYLSSSLATLQLTTYNPHNESLNRYAVSPTRPFEQLFNHTPVHDIRLQHDEELLIIRAKRRLMAVVSQAPIPWAPAGGRLAELGYVCVPLYSFHQNDSPEFRARVQAMEYPWWVYFPANDNLRIYEGFARLDRIQVIEKNMLSPRSVALTEDGLWLLSEWVRYYLTEEIEPLFMEDRRDRLTQLP